MYELKNLRTGKKILLHPIEVYLALSSKKLEELGYEHSELDEGRTKIFNDFVPLEE